MNRSYLTWLCCRSRLLCCLVFASFACGSQGQELDKRELDHAVPKTTSSVSRPESGASTSVNAGALPADRSANISARNSQIHGRKRGDGDRKTTSTHRYSCPSILDITLASPPPETTAAPSGERKYLSKYVVEVVLLMCVLLGTLLCCLFVFTPINRSRGNEVDSK